MKCMYNRSKSRISVFTKINNDYPQYFKRTCRQGKDRLELLYWFNLQLTLIKGFWTFPHDLSAHFTAALNWIRSIEGTHGKLNPRSWFVDSRLHSWQLVLARICPLLRSMLPLVFIKDTPAVRGRALVVATSIVVHCVGPYKWETITRKRGNFSYTYFGGKIRSESFP